MNEIWVNFFLLKHLKTWNLKLNLKRHQSKWSTTKWIKMLWSFVCWKWYGWIFCVNMMETFSFCLTLWLRLKCYLLNFCPCCCRLIICLVSFFSFSPLALFDQNFFEVGLMNYFVNTFYCKFDFSWGFPSFTFYLKKKHITTQCYQIQPRIKTCVD